MGVVNSALRAVISGEWFARSGGHDHLLPAHSWRFTVWANKKRGSGVGLPAETWALLENVTQTRNEYYAMSPGATRGRIATASRRCGRPRRCCTRMSMS